MLLEFQDFYFADGGYFRDIPNGLIQADELPDGRWVASVHFDDYPGTPIYSVKDEEPELAANGLISLISDLQDDGGETALRIKITHQQGRAS